MKHSYYFLKDFRVTTALLLLLLLALFTKNVFAQTPPPSSVNITVNIAGPYSPFYADYAGPNASKVLLIVQNLTATQKKIKLTGRLQGNNGIRITTKSNYIPLQPIILNPNETKQLNGLALKDIFDLNSLNVYGVDKVKLVQTSRLPEGDYTFCIEAVDMNTNQVISSSAPLGCTMISIIYPDAPFLIDPSVNATTPGIKGLNFTWGNAGSVPNVVEYTFEIAEMPLLVRTDPNQIFNSTSFLWIKKTVFNSTSTTLLPSDPPLIEGRRYAWRVKAIDPTGKIIFKNNGLSRANEFRYGEKIIVPSVFTLNTPQAKRRFTNFNDLVFDWKFTDNSGKNDNIGFYDGIAGRQQFNFGNSKYELYVTRVKTIEEKKADSIAEVNNRRVAARSAKSGAANTSRDAGIVIPTNNTNISYKAAQELKDYLKDENNYEWYIRDRATGTVSEKRQFAIKYEKAVVNYTIALSGTLKYNFYKDYITGSAKKNKLQKNPNEPVTLSEEEKGNPLANKSIQVLRVSLLAPKIKVNRKVTKIENGLERVTTEMQDSIAMVSDLQIYPYGPQKLASSTIIAHGTTDGMGNFKVDVPIDRSKFKVLDSNVIVPNRTTAYALIEGLVVRVNDNRFSDPNWYIMPNPDKTGLDLAEQTVEIYGYNANVKLQTNVQRDFKGKLYLLRNNDNILKGEVKNMIGVQKEIPTYKTAINAKGKTVIVGKGLTSYTVVGINDINALNTGELSSSFSKMAVAGAKSNDGYTVYFEPANEQDALYFNPVYVSNGQGKTATFSSTDFAYRNLTEQIAFGPKFISMQLTGRYVYNWKNPNGKTNAKLPLPEGTSLTLVKGNMSQKDFFKGGTTLNEERIISTTTIKKNGEYSFDVGLTDYNNFNSEGNHLVILVSSDYYYSQPYSITYNQNENIKVPELTATVRQYNYISKVGYLSGGVLNPKGGMNVYLCRKISDEKANAAKYFDRPVNVGNPDRNYFKKTIENNGEQYEIIDMMESSGAAGKVGEFEFKRLLVSKSTAERYYIISEPTSASQDNFITKDAYDLTKNHSMDGIKQGLFTDDQNITTLDFNIGYAHIPVLPLVPYIDGAVYPNSNASTSVLSGVNVEMFSMDGLAATANNDQIANFLADKTPNDEMITKTNGRFLFENVNAKSSAWKLLRLTKKGFLITYVRVQQGKPLINGQRGNLGKVYMDLPRELMVKVVDKSKKKINARIIVGDDFSWEDYDSSVILPKIMQSPLGNVAFNVIPDDRKKYKATKVYKFIDLSTTAVELEVADNQHVLYVSCKIKGTNTFLPAQVKVLNTKNYTQTAKSFGNPYTEVIIPAGGTQFDLRIVPDDINYTIAKTQVYSDGQTSVAVAVEVQPAVTLTIKATQEYMKAVKNGMFTTFKKDIQKASAYDVFIKELAEDEYEIINQFGKGAMALIALNQSDTRIIGRLPSKLPIHASITKKGYIGDEQWLFPFGQNMNKTFNLKFAPELNVTTMYGFPIALTNAYEQANGQYLISGRLDPNVSSGNLTVKTTADMLEFKNVYVNVNDAPSGIKKDRYFTLSEALVFNQNSVDGKLFNKYEVKIINNTGISLNPATNTTGSILGKVALDMSSFSKGVETSRSDVKGERNHLYLGSADDKYALLTSPPSQKTAPYLNTFSTATSDLSATSYMVATSAKEKPSFYGADDIQVVPDGKAILTASGIAFDGIIKTNLYGVAQVHKSIDARAHYNLDNDGFTQSNQEKFSIKLFNWELKVDSWHYGTTGLFVKGNLIAQGLTVPFSDLQIFNDKIGFGKFNVTNLKILNAFPITINGSQASVSFGYDRGYSKQSGAWSLSVLAKAYDKNSTYLAGLKGLDDLQPNDVIQIKNINLYDTGNENDTRLILDENQPAVTVNKIAKFKPGTIWGSSTFMTIRGDLNMEIPGFTGLDAVVYDLTYRVDANGILKHKHEAAFANLGLDSKGMLVKFSNKIEDQKFSGGELMLKGILKDKDPTASYQIAVELTKKEGSTQLAIPSQINNATPRVYLTYNTNDVTNHLANYNSKVMAGTESYLNAATGKSVVKNNQWEYFNFSGTLTGASGIDPTSMDFTIKGDVVANSSHVGVQNMDAGGVKGLSIVYDFKEKALIGSGHVHQDASFGVLDLDIEMKLGSSNWYMFSNGIADVKNTPFNRIGVGFMVGNSEVTPTQRASLYTHFNDKGLPPNADATFGNIKGVLFILSAQMPIPLLPTIDLDLDPVAKCEFKHGFYAAAYFKANFFNAVKETSFTVGGRVGAFVKLSAGASIGLACAGVSLGADMRVDLVGSLAPLQQKFSASAQLGFDLTGSAYVGAGICNSSCETPCWDAGLFEVCSPIPCKKIGLTKSMKITVGATIDNSGFHASQEKTYQ